MFIRFFHALKYVFNFLCLLTYFRLQLLVLLTFSQQTWRSCVQLPAQREDLQVGQASVSAVQQDLGVAQVPSQDLGVRVRERGAVRDVPEPVLGVQVQRQRAVDGVRDLCQGFAHLPREGVVQMEQETLSFLART